MKKYQARKAISVLLTVLMLLSSVYAGLGVVASAVAMPSAPLQTTGSLSGSTVYTVSTNTTIYGGGLTVPEGKTVFIDIASGITLTVQGGDANGKTAGSAAITMNKNSKLVFIGSGTLVVKGGKGGNGGRGKANSGSTGGAGGDGGGGGGAGIGAAGGAGGSASSGDGTKAGTWPSGASVYVADTVSFTGGTDGGNGTKGGSVNVSGGGNTAGGTGGGGGSGSGGFAIGAGGYGGGAGGQGSNGGSTGGCDSVDYKGKGGGGGKGAANGDGGKGSNDNNASAGGSGGQKGAEGSSAGYTRTTAFSDMATAISNNSGYYGKTMAELVAIDVDTLRAVKTAVETPYNVITANFGADIYDYYFNNPADAATDYDTATLISNLEGAIAMAANIALAQELQAFAENGFDTTANYAALNYLYSYYTSVEGEGGKYTKYQALSADTRAFLESYGYIVPSAVESRLSSLKFYMDCAQLRENYYNTITGNVTTYSAYNDDWVIATADAGTQLSAAIGTITSHINTLTSSSMNQDAVTEVFGQNYVDNTLRPLNAQLTDLVAKNDLKVEFEPYRTLYNTAFAPITPANLSTDQLYSLLNEYDSWYTELETFVANLKETQPTFAAKLLGELWGDETADPPTKGIMQEKIDSIYVTLNARLTATIDTAYDYYSNFVTQYGYEINTQDDVTVANYNTLKNTFAQLNPDHYAFLMDSVHFAIPQGTQNKYNEINNAVFAFVNYDISMGLSAYTMNNQIEVKDILREVTDSDVIRNLDYTVAADERQMIYDKVKALLNTDLLKNLLGGENGLDLSSLGDTLKDKIFSDSLVNTLVQFVYPVVVKEFAKVWAGIPSSVPITDPVSTTINLSINDMPTALDKLGLYVLPKQLAGQITGSDSYYSAIKSALNQVPNTATYNVTADEWTVNPWENANIYNAETKKIEFDWGIDSQETFAAKKARFIDAMSVALKGVEPLLLALLSNKTYSKENVKVGTGSGKVYVIFTVTVDPIALTMTFKGNPGYNNALAPILNVLGATNLPDGNTLTTVRAVAEYGLANPLEEIINKLSADPIDFILEALPNLVFALMTKKGDNNLAQLLLNELKTSIQYWADASYSAAGGCASGTIQDALNSKDDRIDINLGTMLDLTALGFDISSAQGLIGSLVTLLGKKDETEETEETTEPDSGEAGEEEPTGIAAILNALPGALFTDDPDYSIAYLGNGVIWNNGYRTVSPYGGSLKSKLPYITSNPADIFVWLVITLLNDDNFLPAVLTALGMKVDMTNTKDVLVQILGNVMDHPELVVAALSELMDPVVYDNWAEIQALPDYRMPAYLVEEGEEAPAYNAADVAYLKYANDWDKTKAEAIANNIDELIPSITGMLGSETSLNETLQNALNGLFTNENLTKINNLLAGLAPAAAPAPEGDTTDPVDPDEPGEGDGEATEEGGLGLGAILKDVLGIDLSVLTVKEDNYNWGFEDGAEDAKTAFVNALCSILEPLAPVLKIMLPGQDLTAIEYGEGENKDSVLKVFGYDVYNKSIKLLFDALGVANITYNENTKPVVMLRGILNNLLAWVDDLTDPENSMVKSILELLPGLVHFIETNGLSVVIKNLLYPIQILIDTIRPIYDIDIFELVSKLGKDDAPAAEGEGEGQGEGEDQGQDTEPTGIAAILGKINLDDLRLSSIIKIVDDMLGTDLADSPLCTYAVPALALKKDDLDAADVLTVLLCGVIEALEYKIDEEAGTTNADALFGWMAASEDEKLKGIGEKLAEMYPQIVLLVTGDGTQSEIEKINWTYMYNGEIILESFEMPEVKPTEMATYLSYTNDWTKELAEYVNTNLNSVVATILGFVKPDTDLAALLDGLINDKLYTADIINMLGNGIAGLLENLGDLLGTIDILLDTNVSEFSFEEVESIDGKDEFIEKLEEILAPLGRLLDFALFGKSYKFFNGSTREDLIVLSGVEVYNAALVPVLEALGVTMPSFDGTATTGDKIHAILVAVTDWLDKLTTEQKDDNGNVTVSVIDNIFELLPNVLYFLNANGLKAAINNAVLPLDALVKLVKGEGIEALLPEEVAGLPLYNMTTANLLEFLAQKTELTIPTAERNAISTFFIGRAEKYDSANGNIAFRMVYKGDRKDMITLLVSVLLDIIVNNTGNPEKLDEMFGTDGLIANAVEALGGISYKYQPYKWNYYVDGADPDGPDYTVGIDDGASITDKDDIAYLNFYNDWTEEKAAYLDAHLEDIVDDVLAKYDTIPLDALQKKLSDALYTNDTVKSLMDLISGFVGKIPAELLGLIGQVVKVDFSGLLAYDGTLPCDVTDKASFLDALFGDDGLLTPFDRVFRFLLLGKSYEYFVSAQNDGDSIIVIPGALGYEKGLAPLLEALGVTLPTVGDANGSGTKLMSDVVANVLTRVEDILNVDNILTEALSLVPEVLYFINANGLTAAANNTLSAVITLINMVADFGVDLSEIQNTLDSYIGDLSIDGILALVEEHVGIAIPENIVGYLKNNTVGTIESYGSVYGPAYRVKAEKEVERSYVITCLLSAAIETVAYDGNAAKIDAMISKDGEEPSTLVQDLVAILTEGADFEPYTVDWNYKTGESNDAPTISEAPKSTTYLGYTNNWNEPTADYVNEHLDEIVNIVINKVDSNYETLSAFATDKLYSSNVINAIGGALKSLAETVSDALSGFVGASGAEMILDLLGVDLETLKGYEDLPDDAIDGDRNAFVEELITLLRPLERLFGFLLNGEDYRFFVDSNSHVDPVTEEAVINDQIVIKGYEGYKNGLVLLLEALGCEIADADSEDIIADVINALFDRVDAILGDDEPVGEVLKLLPNLIYFINAGGLTASVNNTILAVTALYNGVLTAIGKEPNLNALLANVSEYLTLDNLSFDMIYAIVKDKTGIDLESPIGTYIAEFKIGIIDEYTSASGDENARKMTINDEDERRDMLTILASLLLEVLDYRGNETAFRNLLGDDAYQLVYNILNLKENEAPIQVPNWLYTEFANTDKTFSGINTSTEFGGYGPLFTQDKAVYIADNLDAFIDNMIQLLGIPADKLYEMLGIQSREEYITSMDELLTMVIGESIYTPDVARTILGYIKNAVAKINELPASDHIKAALRTALSDEKNDFNLDYYNTYTVPEFEKGDQEAFLNTLCDILKPLYPLLQWLLSDQDIALFLDSEDNDQVILPGAEGYTYGIAPLFEALDVADIPSQEAINSQETTEDLIKAIATPLFGRIDEIIEHPVDEIFELLPEIAYFVNSNGLDTCFKNLLNAVYTVLNAIKPLTDNKVLDLYEVLNLKVDGKRIDELDMQTIMDILVEKIAEGSDQDLQTLVVDAVAEMTTGKIITYDSTAFDPAFKMEYAGQTSKADTVTILLRFALRWIALNADQLKALIREKVEMTDEGYAYIDKLIDITAAYAGTNSGMDSLLHMLYYIFYGIHNGSAAVAGWQRDYNSRFEAIAEGQVNASKRDENLGKVAELLDWLFVTYGDGDKDDTGNVYHNYDDDEMGSPAAGKPKGFAPNGFIAFFRQIIEWFKTIFNKIFKH